MGGKSFLRNIGHAFSSNVIVLLASVLTNLVVPKFLGVAEFGYWQLYVFYTSYVAITQLGWLDGIYLRIGGQRIRDLDQVSVRTQFWLFLLLQVAAAVAIWVAALIYGFQDEIWQVIIFTVIALVAYNALYFISMVLQATNHIQQYARVIRNDRLLFLVLLAGYLAMGGRAFQVMICIDLVAKISIALIELLIMKRLFVGPLTSFKTLRKEIVENISAGSKVLISGLSSLACLGASRLFVSLYWTIETFGILSFAMGIMNMFMVFINSVGLVLFPALRRMTPERVVSVYLSARVVFTPLAALSLLAYYPAKIILGAWLPQYKESLVFMGVVFAAVVFDGKVGLLITPLIKALRLEGKLLRGNLIALAVSVVLSFVAAAVLRDITLVALVLVLVSGLRALILERYLVQALDAGVGTYWAPSVLITAAFVLLNLFLPAHAFWVFALVVAASLLAQAKKLRAELKALRG